MNLRGALLLDKKNDTLLYAGEVKVNLTDWFFLKDNIVLKYISLSDAVININRKDSAWNYQFLIDYFSSPSKKTDTSTNVIKLDLKHIELNHIKVWQQDAWVGTDMLISLDKLIVDMDSIDMRNKKVNIRSLSIDAPHFAQFEYNGARPTLRSSNNAINHIVKNELKWNPEYWLVKVKELKVTNGGLAIERATNRPIYTDRFDDNHIIFSDINATFLNLNILQDTITANVSLAALNRSGFKVKKLNALVKFTPELMEFNKLDIITNKSHLTNYFSMRYKDFTSDMNNFIHSVFLAGNFKNTQVNSDDIAYFAPELKSWKRSFTLNGKASGYIDNFKGEDVTITSGPNYFIGDFILKGLPDIDKTFISLNSDNLITSYNDLSSFIPSIKNITAPNFKALGNINFKGSYSGTIYNFTTKGILTTNLGSLQTDIHINLPSKGVASYSGNISTTHFHLGKFIGNDKIGSTSFSGSVSGKGFSSTTMDLFINGSIKSIEFNNYNYQNINTTGTIKNKMFSGSASINDPNLKIDTLTGIINFNKNVPEFRFTALLANSNLKNLHLFKEDLVLKGIFNLNFSGKSIDDFQGSARVYKATLKTNGKQLPFDSLVINSYYANGQKYLNIQSDEIDASISGAFKIINLPDAFSLLLNKYYPSYIPKPSHSIDQQKLSFTIKTRNIGDYISLFDKRLGGFNNSSIEGNLDISANALNINASFPLFNYKKLSFNNVLFTANGNNDSLTLNSLIGETIINDSLHLPDTKIKIQAHNDISDISIKTSANQALNEADLSARVQNLPEGFYILFNPSSFVINNKKWILEKGGILTLNKSIFSASEVKFTQEKQELIISTTPSISGANDINLALKNINIGDVMPYVFKSPSLDGLLTGNIVLTDPFKPSSTITFDTHIDQFRFEGDSVGLLQAKGEYSLQASKLKAKVISDNFLYKFMSDVQYNGSDTSNQFGTSVTLNHSDIHILDKYLSSILSGIKGNVTGTLNITGKTSAPKLTGQVSLDNASMTVDYTRCRYIINDHSIINFNPNEIDLGSLKIRDTLNHTATVTGKIYHEFFSSFFFDNLNFSTDRSGEQLGKVILLNTSLKDNKDFYGHVIGDATLSLNGPENDMSMYITCESTDSSHIYLPTTESTEAGRIDYIDFIKFGHEINSYESLKQQSNIKVNIEAVANPYTTIDVILDEVTGDVIKARGNGKLNISAGTRDPLIIRGRYELEEGDYTFNFQTFVKTPFKLQQGYIEWQGDPYLANLNIDAAYIATNVDQQGVPTGSGYNKTRGDIQILFKLRGTLKDPRPEFELQFTDQNPLKNDPIANEYISTRLQADKNELNKQVTALLLFNSFITSDQSLLTANNTVNFATRGIGQVLSNTLSSSLTSWVQRLLKTNAVNLYTNINTSDFNFQKGVTQKDLQNLGTFGFKTSFLKNRLLLSVGGNVDYRLIQATNNSSSNFLFTPDISFEFLLTKDGKVRLIGFNRTDATLGDIEGISRRNRTGLSVSYRKDFNTLQQLFGKKSNGPVVKKAETK